jgi:hypothetical protein
MSWRAGPLAPPSLGKLFHTRTWSHLHLERCRSTTPLCIRGWRTSSCTVDRVSGAPRRVPSQALGPGTHRRSCLPLCLCNKEIRSESQLSQLQACQTFDLEIYIWDLYTIYNIFYLACAVYLPVKDKRIGSTKMRDAIVAAPLVLQAMAETLWSNRLFFEMLWSCKDNSM